MLSDREHIGNLYVEHQRLLDEYRNLLGLVEQVSVGNVKPEQVAVDADNLSWSLKPISEDAAEAEASPCPT